MIIVLSKVKFRTKAYLQFAGIVNKVLKYLIKFYDKSNIELIDLEIENCRERFIAFYAKCIYKKAHLKFDGIDSS